MHSTLETLKTLLDIRRLTKTEKSYGHNLAKTT